VTFCEVNSEVKEVKWPYVGDNKGSYSSVPHYNYVGEGHGNFANVPHYSYVGEGAGSSALHGNTMYHGWRFRKFCWAVLAALLLPICFCCILWWLKSSPSWPQTTSAMPTFSPNPSSSPWTTSLPYDCNVDFVDCNRCLLDRWSVGKRIWCCRHAQRGCDVPDSTTKEGYDCSVGLTNWKIGWSDSKKSWCCHHGGKGC